MLFPEIRRVMGCLSSWPSWTHRHYSDFDGTQSGGLRVPGSIGCGGRRQGIAEHTLLVAPPLNRRWNPHGLAVLGDGATGDINAGGAQTFHDGVVGKDQRRIFRID